MLLWEVGIPALVLSVPIINICTMASTRRMGVVVVDLCSLWWDVTCVQQIALALHTPQLTGVLQFL